MVKPGRLLLRCDAGPEIGAGHVMRCLALAQAWQEQGGTAAAAMAASTPAIEQRLRSEGVPVQQIEAEAGSAADAEKTFDCMRRQPPQWLVVDGYRLRSAYRAGLQAHGIPVLVFDDMGDNGPYEDDIVLNGNAYAAAEMYGQRGAGTELLLGSRYQPLRREFWRFRQWRCETPPQARNLLLTFGAGDPEQVTGKALQAVALLKSRRMNVRVLVGAANPALEELRSLAASLGQALELRVAVEDMSEEMAWADLAVSAAGSTCWELAFMGAPSVLLTVADNQQGNGDFAARQHTAISLGWHAAVTPAQIAEAVDLLAGDQARRREMSARARALVDGRGGERVVKAMLRRIDAGAEA